jgi:hypothetical protein
MKRPTELGYGWPAVKVLELIVGQKVSLEIYACRCFAAVEMEISRKKVGRSLDASDEREC